jgi:hypothetical protein
MPNESHVLWPTTIVLMCYDAYLKQQPNENDLVADTMVKRAALDAQKRSAEFSMCNIQIEPTASTNQQ